MDNLWGILMGDIMLGFLTFHVIKLLPAKQVENRRQMDDKAQRCRFLSWSSPQGQRSARAGVHSWLDQSVVTVGSWGHFLVSKHIIGADT